MDSDGCRTPSPERPAEVACRRLAAAQRAFAEAEADTCTFVCLSDTHNKHGQLGELPPGDVLLHAGDFTLRGTLAETESFAEWWHAQTAFKQRFLVPGNHDHCLDAAYEPETLVEIEAHKQALHHVHAARLLHRPEAGSYLLLDSGAVTSRGNFSVYGAPWQPLFWGSFNLPRAGTELASKWAAIPPNANVVISHGPPHGKRDYVPRSSQHVGCELLTRELLGRPAAERPAASVFGHVHEGYGVCRSHCGQIVFVNASSCNTEYEPVNTPVVFQLRRDAAGVVSSFVIGHDDE
jgi:predicted phosphodiesterase